MLSSYIEKFALQIS